MSTAPAVKAWLFGLLQTSLTGVAGEGLLVVWNTPGKYLPGDVVSVGDVLNRVTDRAAFLGGGGAGYLDETYSLEVVVDVYRGGDNARAAEARGWDLLGQVEQLVRADLTAGGTPGVFALRPGAAEARGEWEDDHSGHHVRLTLAVDVGARI